MQKKIYLHIGMHKAASTSIQYGLSMNADALSNLGYLYPVTGMFYWGQHNIPWQLIGHYMYDNAKGTINELLNEIDNAQHENVIISSEEFSIFSHKNIMALGKLLKRYDVKIIIYIRNQVDWFQSMWGEVTKGRSGVQSIISLNEWTTKLLNDNSMNRFLPYAKNFGNYLVILENWADAFGEESVNVKVFDQEKDGDLFGNFLCCLGILDHASIAKTGKLNESYNIRKIDLIRRLRIALREKGESEKLIDTVKEKILKSEVSNNMERIVYISENNYDRIVKKFSEINRIISERYFNGREIFSFDRATTNFGKINDLTGDEYIKIMAHLLVESKSGEDRLLAEQDQVIGVLRNKLAEYEATTKKLWSDLAEKDSLLAEQGQIIAGLKNELS